MTRGYSSEAMRAPLNPGPERSNNSGGNTTTYEEQRRERMLAALAQLRENPPANIDPTWRERAACKDEDPNLFVPDPQNTKQANERRAKEAKVICRGCEVREPCLEEANIVEADRELAIRGGLTAEERALMRVRDLTAEKAMELSDIGMLTSEGLVQAGKEGRL